MYVCTIKILSCSNMKPFQSKLAILKSQYKMQATLYHWLILTEAAIDITDFILLIIFTLDVKGY